jgi:hypothetical protein
LNFQNPLYLEFPWANAVRCIPVQLGIAYRTIRQLDGCSALQLPPALTSIDLRSRRSSRMLLPEAMVSMSEMLPSILNNTRLILLASQTTEATR